MTGKGKDVKLPEHIERARELSRDVNILDLEDNLSREMKSIGFSKSSDSDLSSVRYENGISCQGLELMDIGGSYFREGFHDKDDKLIYGKDKAFVLIRKMRIENPGYWENTWGADISFRFDLGDFPDLKEEQAKSIPPNQNILNRLFSDYEGVGEGNAFSGRNDILSGHFPILCVDSNLVYHQFLGFSRQSGLEGKAKYEFIAKVAENISRLAFLNNQYVSYQLKVYESLKEHKKAFELILKAT